MPGSDIYDAMGADYESMVGWDARIANETPFFRELFDARGIRRVIDVACGVGRHAVVFASWGLDVVGADPSKQLLSLARNNATAAGASVEFVEADFLHLASATKETFDAAVCIGNSLQHLLSREGVLAALVQMNRVLEPGGTLVLQNRSAERIWARGTHLLTPALRAAGSHQRIFLRLVDVHPPTTTLNVIRLEEDGAGWQADSKSTELRPICRDEMAEVLSAAGFGEAEFYGNYQRAPFAGKDSQDLLVAATKTGEAS